MFENPRRGRQARNFGKNVPKILDLKSSSEHIFSENCRWVPLNIAASKIGNGVISLLCQLRCHCNPDHDKFSSLSNTTVVAIFQNACLWRRSLCSNLAGMDPEKLYRATFICQYGLCCRTEWPSFLFDCFVGKKWPVRLRHGVYWRVRWQGISKHLNFQTKFSKQTCHSILSDSLKSFVPGLRKLVY